MTIDHFTDEHFMRGWVSEGFRLELFETNIMDDGRTAIAYRLWDDTFDELYSARAPIFEAADFWSSPLHSIDGDESMRSLLTFLSLRPGDTDAEYFEAYTERQRAWCEERAEDLFAAALLTFGEEL